MENGIIVGIHNVFPADEDDNKDPLLLTKMKKLESMWALEKDILRFTFDGTRTKLCGTRPNVIHSLQFSMAGSEMVLEELGYLLTNSSRSYLNSTTPSLPYRVERASYCHLIPYYRSIRPSFSPLQ